MIAMAAANAPLSALGSITIIIVGVNIFIDILKTQNNIS